MKLYSNVCDYAIYTQIISCRLILNTFFAHSKTHNHCAYTLIIIKNNFFSLMYIRMSWKNINFDDKKIKKSELCKNKRAFQIDGVDVSKKEPYSTKNTLKYFIGYNNNDVIRPLCLRLPQMTGYAKKLNENATMSFKANNKQLLRNYNKIWEKVEKLLKIDFESKPV